MCGATACRESHMSQDGKNKMKKSTTQNQNNTPKSDCCSNSFVPIVSCFYCDEVSFDVDDQNTYVDHLMKAHKILKNTKSLLEATLTLQNELQKDESVEKDVQENNEDLQLDESKTTVADNIKSKSAKIPTEDLSDERMINENHIDKENNVTLSEIVEKRNPAFAGLPIDESADAWMNDDVVPMIESDDDDDDGKQTDTQDTMLEAEYKKSEFAGLPIDESSDNWMNDDVAPIPESDEESEKENPDDIPIVEKEISV